MEPLFIVEVFKSGQDRLSRFKMSNGEVYGYSQVIDMVESGRIKNVEVRQLDDGSKHLYYNPDTMTSNDLYNVPENLYELNQGGLLFDKSCFGCHPVKGGNYQHYQDQYGDKLQY